MNSQYIEDLTSKGEGIDIELKYCPTYSDRTTPIIEERGVFKLTIKYDNLQLGGGGENLTEKQKQALAYFSVARTSREILEEIGLVSHSDAVKKHIVSLVDAGLSAMIIPDKPNSRLQKYVVREK